MPDSHLTLLNLRSAPRGSKKGWPTVTSQVPPETFEKLEAIRLRKGLHRGDAGAEAIAQYVEREAA